MANGTKLKGMPVDIMGNFVCAGMPAPDFLLSRTDLSDYKLSNVRGKTLLLNIFPSLDTSVCALSVRKFNRDAANIKNAEVLCISRDLPFAQKRFCVAEGIENSILLSDFHYNSTFGEDYGVLMTSGLLNGLLARAVVIIKDGKITYAAMSPEIVEEPDYNAALRALSD